MKNVRQQIFKYYIFFRVYNWRCGGLVVRVLASRPPVLGSNLGPGTPHSVVSGAADHTIILYK